MTNTGATNTAAVLLRAGEVVLEDRPEPVPAPHEVVVEIRSVGVCGSDVHYYRHGRIGNFVVEAPLVLGHEASGTVVEVGERVTRLRVGQRVAVEPGVPDGTCAECLAGRYNLCPDVRFLATPPVDGAFVRRLAVTEAFAHPVPDRLSDDAAALIEPLAVAVVACRKAGVGVGSTVLVTGAGPIGVLTAQVARCAGAAHVVLTDVSAQRRARAKPLVDADILEPDEVPDDLRADAFVECSGAPAAATAGLGALRPAGRAVLVGMGAETIPLPVALVQTRELVVTGSFRYANAHPQAIALAAGGSLDLDQLVDARFGLADTEAALQASQEDPALLKAVVRVQE